MAEPVLSDAELLAAARNGDEPAFTELYVRHHAAARRLAITYRNRGDPDDLVNGAFERVLVALRRGGGPTTSFRAYLFVTLRRLAMEHGCRNEPVQLDEVPDPVMAVTGVPELGRAEQEIVARAFESLPNRWQTVLWQTAVEGRSPRELAGMVGMSANATAALAYRARERLRQEYLQAHLHTRARRQCEPHRSRLGGYVRDALNRRDRSAMERHLRHCDSCKALADELGDVNQLLVRSVMPLFLAAPGSAMAAVVEPATTATAAAGGSSTAGASPVGTVEASEAAAGVWGRLRDVHPLVAAASAGAAVAVAVAMSFVPNIVESTDDRQTEVEGGSVVPLHGAGREAPPDATPPAEAAAPVAPTDDAPPDGPDDVAAPEPPPDPEPQNGPLVDAEVNLPGLQVEAGIGLDPVDVDAGVALDLGWVAEVTGTGRLTIHVVNETGQPLPGLQAELQLSADARALSDTCGPSGGGLLGGVIGLLRSVTCTLGEITAGAGVSTEIPVEVTRPGQTATVVLRQAGEMVATETIALPVG